MVAMEPGKLWSNFRGSSELWSFDDQTSALTILFWPVSSNQCVAHSRVVELLPRPVETTSNGALLVETPQPTFPTERFQCLTKSMSSSFTHTVKCPTCNSRASTALYVRDRLSSTFGISPDPYRCTGRVTTSPRSSTSLVSPPMDGLPAGSCPRTSSRWSRSCSSSS